MAHNARIQILSCEIKEGVAKESGKPFRIANAQCIFYELQADGSESILVGVLPLPRGIECPPPGIYYPQYSIRRDFKKNELLPQLVGFIAHQDNNRKGGGAPSAS